jgi:hypothetical protein
MDGNESQTLSTLSVWLKCCHTPFFLVSKFLSQYLMAAAAPAAWLSVSDSLETGRT